MVDGSSATKAASAPLARMRGKEDAPTPTAVTPADPFEGAQEPRVDPAPAFTAELPRKRIVTPRDLERFADSPAMAELLGFVRACNERLPGCKLTDAIEESEVCRRT